MPRSLRFAAGALVGVLVVLPGALDETPAVRALLLIGAALAFGAFSLRRLGRVWDRLGPADR